MMEAVNISETSVNLYENTRLSIPEGFHLHIRSRAKPEISQIQFILTPILAYISVGLFSLSEQKPANGLETSHKFLLPNSYLFMCRDYVPNTQRY
jgi:hypothetical protein